MSEAKVFKILSFELIVFIGAVYSLMQIRKYTMMAVKIVEGLRTYVPPSDGDFEVLEKTNKKPKTNMKGEVKKNERSRAKQQARFPMRTLEIDHELLKHN